MLLFNLQGMEILKGFHYVIYLNEMGLTEVQANFSFTKLEMFCNLAALACICYFN